MRFQLASFLIASLSATALGRKCGTESPSEALKSQAVKFAAEALANPQFAIEQAAATISVNTYFHVISSGSSPSQGNIPDSQLTQQVSSTAVANVVPFTNNNHPSNSSQC